MQKSIPITPAMLFMLPSHSTQLLSRLVILTLQTPHPRAPPLTRKIIRAVRNREAIVRFFAFAVVVTVVVSIPVSFLRRFSTHSKNLQFQ
jgi:hypothetical protein